MLASIPIFKKDSSNNPILPRSEYDGNSFADMNKLQEQIGDLNNFNTNFGDLTNDLNSNINLTTFFNYLKDKILNDADNDPSKKSKIKQHGIDLLPEGLIIFIAGDNVNNEPMSNGLLAGLKDCPKGYIECDNIDIINSLNSIFNNGTNKSPNLKGHFLRGEGVGVNNSNPLNISIGNIDGQNSHLHTLVHEHQFIHTHIHGHTSKHKHNLDHTHNISDSINHFHVIESSGPWSTDHRHRVKGSTTYDKASNFRSNATPFDAQDDDDSHYHDFDIYSDYTDIETTPMKLSFTSDEVNFTVVSGVFVTFEGSLSHMLQGGDSIIYDGEIVTIGLIIGNNLQVSPPFSTTTPGLVVSFNPKTDSMHENINSSIPNVGSSFITTGYSTNPTNTDNYMGDTENADMFPKSKKVKFCMKV